MDKIHTRISHRDLRPRHIAIPPLNRRRNEQHQRSHASNDDGEEDGGFFVGGPSHVPERVAEEVGVFVCAWVYGEGGVGLVEAGCCVHFNWRRGRLMWLVDVEVGEEGGWIGGGCMCRRRKLRWR